MRLWPFHSWKYRNPACRTCRNCGQVEMQFMYWNGRTVWEVQYEAGTFLCSGVDTRKQVNAEAV